MDDGATEVDDEQNLCPKCGGKMAPGVALLQTWVRGMDDFPGSDNAIGQTMVVGGPGKLVDVIKCEACGHSKIPAAGDSPEPGPSR